MACTKIILFYKRLVVAGGAERLLLEEYRSLKKDGYTVEIVTYAFEEKSLYHEFDNMHDMKIIGDDIFSIYRLSRYLSKQRNAHIISASGDIDLYFATLLLRNISYSIHIHQPTSMTYSLDTKYSIFHVRYLKDIAESNFGGQKILDIYRSLSIFDKIIINIKSYFVIKFVKKAMNIFVLSEYAKMEKKKIFNVDSYVECGALDDDIFGVDINFSGIDKKYSKYQNKLLSISRLDKNKRVDVTIEAFSLFLQNNPNSILLIGGVGPELEYLKALVGNLNISTSVEFLGFIDDKELLGYYKLADLFISIDWADYRITSFEAMAMGTKVLMASEAECDNYLKENGYIYISEAEPNLVDRKIREALNTEISISEIELKERLIYYTWSKYSRRLLEHINKSEL